jgi:hypothetical protein
MPTPPLIAIFFGTSQEGLPLLNEIRIQGKKYRNIYTIKKKGV